jgi:hypothetical protein
MGLFKKSDVPAELPDIALDEIRKESLLSSPPLQTAVSSSVSNASLKPVTSPAISVQQASPPLRVVSAQTIEQPVQSTKDESGYFKELVKSVTEGTGDVDSLHSWYNETFMPGDIVFQMREYWERQQPEILLKNISGDLKNKLIDKTNHLHSLEKEWQQIYFGERGADTKRRTRT